MKILNKFTVQFPTIENFFYSLGLFIGYDWILGFKSPYLKRQYTVVIFTFFCFFTTFITVLTTKHNTIAEFGLSIITVCAGCYSWLVAILLFVKRKDFVYFLRWCRQVNLQKVDTRIDKDAYYILEQCRMKTYFCIL